MRTITTALQFFKDIEKEQDKYKLINGLFIVRYLDSDRCFYVGDFLKSGDAENKSKTNKVRINPSFQIFNSKKMTTTNILGYEKPLGIGWKEQNIKEILK